MSSLRKIQDVLTQKDEKENKEQAEARTEPVIKRKVEFSDIERLLRRRAFVTDEGDQILEAIAKKQVPTSVTSEDLKHGLALLRSYLENPDEKVRHLAHQVVHLSRLQRRMLKRTDKEAGVIWIACSAIRGSHKNENFLGKLKFRKVDLTEFSEESFIDVCGAIQYANGALLEIQWENLCALDVNRLKHFCDAIQNSKLSSVKFLTGFIGFNDKFAQFESEKFLLICEMIKNLDLTTLNLAEIPLHTLSEAHFQLFCEALQQSTLTSLDFTRLDTSDLGPVKFGALCELLIKPKFKSVEFETQYMDNFSASQIRDFYKAVRRFRIRVLHCRGINMSKVDDELLDAICSAMQCEAVESIDFADVAFNELSQARLLKLCNAIANSKAKKVSLGSSSSPIKKLSVEQFHVLITSIFDSNIDELTLDEDDLSNWDIKKFKLLCVLIKSSKLKVLDFVFYNLKRLNDDQFKMLCEALQKSKLKALRSHTTYTREMLEERKTAFLNAVREHVSLVEVGSTLRYCAETIDVLFRNCLLKLARIKEKMEQAASDGTLTTQSLGIMVEDFINTLAADIDPVLKRMFKGSDCDETFKREKNQELYELEKNFLTFAADWFYAHPEPSADTNQFCQTLISLASKNPASETMRFTAFERVCVDQGPFLDALVCCLMDQDRLAFFQDEKFQVFFDTVLVQKAGIKTDGKSVKLNEEERLILLKYVVLLEASAASSALGLHRDSLPALNSMSDITSSISSLVHHLWRATFGSICTSDLQGNLRLVVEAISQYSLEYLSSLILNTLRPINLSSMEGQKSIHKLKQKLSSFDEVDIAIIISQHADRIFKSQFLYFDRYDESSEDELFDEEFLDKFKNFIESSLLTKLRVLFSSRKINQDAYLDITNELNYLLAVFRCIYGGISFDEIAPLVAILNQQQALFELASAAVAQLDMLPSIQLNTFAPALSAPSAQSSVASLPSKIRHNFE